MSINITDGFNINFAAPVDYRMVTANSTTRLAIAYKYDGLKVFQLDNRVGYIWNSGGSGNWDIENSDKISGSGTTNYIPKFTSSSQIGASSIYVNGDKVGIATNDPKEYMQIGSFPVAYPGQSLPLTIHKGGSAIIGYNWYYDGSDQSFNASVGSSTIGFGGGEIQFQHKEVSSSFKTSLYLNSSGNVLIGTNTPTQILGTSNLFPNSYSKLEVVTGDALSTPGTYQELMTLRHINSDVTAVLRRLGYIMKLSSDTDSTESSKMGGMILESNLSYSNSPSLYLVTNNEKRVTITAAGLVGIDNVSPTYVLTVNGLVQGKSQVTKSVGGKTLYVGSSIWGSDVHLLTGIESVNNNGFIQVTSGDSTYTGSNIGTTPYNLEIQPGGGQTILPNGSVSLPALRFPTSGNTGFYSPATNVLCFGIDGYQRFKLSSSSPGLYDISDFTFNAKYGAQALVISVWPNGYTSLNLSTTTTPASMDITGYSALTVYGGLGCTGTKSFKISHPHPSKSENYDLVHASVESSRIENLYRGKIELSNGLATVNLDTHSNMTDGTFVLFNRDPFVMTTSEDSFIRVRGSVNGNILTIESETPSNDSVSWLIICERCDSDIINAFNTDEDGKLITEIIKSKKN